jgi:hypothetical protein
VRQKREENGIVRWLTDAEETALRAVIDPVHLPELDIALGTGMRLSEQFELTWEQVDFARHEGRLNQDQQPPSGVTRYSRTTPASGGMKPSSNQALSITDGTTTGIRFAHAWPCAA